MARLAQLHGIFHMDEQVPFCFSWDWLAPSGLSTKDFIAPTSFEFRTGKQFRMGKKYGTVSFLQILADVYKRQGLWSLCQAAHST